MKFSVTKCVVYGIVFLVATIFFAILTNRGNMDMTAEMEKATLPLVYLDVDGREVNCLFGHTEPMKTSYVQNSITPMASDRILNLRLDENGDSILNISYELRSIDGSRLIESNTISEYEKEENSITLNIKLKDLLEKTTEYMLVLMLETESKPSVYYYTKLMICDTAVIGESIDFIWNFHQTTYDKEKAHELKKYLESSATADNSNYFKVDIHNSLDMVTWGNLAPQEAIEPIVNIREINGDISGFVLDYVVSEENDNGSNLYRVSEYFRVRYTKTRMYLLDYERTMEKMFEPSEESFDSTKIILGIGDDNIDLSESDDGKNVAFTSADRLFAFNITDEKISLLFSFYEPEDLKRADLNNEHDIKILNVDETGNITFMVYGYMNRGIHEGQTGVVVYTYNSLNAVVSEQAYIPYGKSYEILKQDIEQLSYINRNHKLYLSLEKAIYEINIAEKTCKVLATEAINGECKISKTGRMVVWQDALENDYTAKKLYLMDLSTENIMEINAENNDRITALGFIGEDLVYGLANEEDIVLNDNDDMIFHMHSIIIQNEMGLILKLYKQDNIYVTSANIQEEMIHLKRVVKEVGEEEVTYKKTTDDQIVSAKEDTSGENYVEFGYSNLYKNFVRIVIDGKVRAKDIQFVQPEQELYEGNKNLLVTLDEEYERFYVYNAKGLLGIFDSENEALLSAVDNSAWVVNDFGYYVWRKESRSTKNQIMAIKATDVTEGMTSLGACLDTILAYEGVMRSTSFMLEQGQSVHQILQENLKDVQVLEMTGCSLDNMLYYINKDIPVMVRMGAKKAVLITGFNDKEVVIMDPDKGTLSKVKKQQAETLFEDAGSHYITYVPKN